MESSSAIQQTTAKNDVSSTAQAAATTTTTTPTAAPLVSSSSATSDAVANEHQQQQSSAQSQSTTTPAAVAAVAVVTQQHGPCPFPMGEHVRPSPTFTYYTERYYSQYVIRDCKQTPGNNIRLLMHSNNLCILCLDPSHPLVARRHELKIASLGHTSQKQLSRGGERQPIKVQGKKKKNAVMCQKEMNLCFIETECGQEFKIPAGIDGHLLEINANLVKYPTLIQRFPMTEGFIAIITPFAKNRFDQMEKVWTCTSGELGEADE